MPDEWRSAGLDNAIMAESTDDLEESEKWLDRAVYCFEQEGDSALANKARTHRFSVRFQLNLIESGVDTEIKERDLTQVELDAALLAEKLLAEELFVEARKVCSAVLPLLTTNSQDKLQKQILTKLPCVDDMA